MWHKKILLRHKKIFFVEEDIDEKRSNFGLSGSYFGVEKLWGVGHRSGWVLEGSVWANGWKMWKIRKMDRFGPFGMGICLYDVVLHGESIGKGLRAVKAQKRGVLGKKLDRHPGF